MTAIIKTIENELIIGDTERDILFAEDRSSPYLHYFYHEQGAIYATKKDFMGDIRVEKLSIQELKNSISGAEIINETIAEKAIDLLS